MNICRLKGEFEYIQYVEDKNESEVIKFIKDHQIYEIAHVGNYKILAFCNFNPNTKEITGNIQVVPNGAYLVSIEGEIKMYTEEGFHAVFESIAEGIAESV